MYRQVCIFLHIFIYILSNKVIKIVYYYSFVDDGGHIRQYRKDEVLLENESMQNVLRDCCLQLKIEQPLYTLHHFQDYGNRCHYQYRCALVNKWMGKSPACMGKYARTQFDAREDVAILMLRPLLAGMGQKVIDYNQRNVDWLERQLQRAIDCNVELRIETMS